MNEKIEWELQLLNGLVKPTGNQFTLTRKDKGTLNLQMHKIPDKENSLHLTVSDRVSEEEMEKLLFRLQGVMTFLLSDIDGLKKLINLVEVKN